MKKVYNVKNESDWYSCQKWLFSKGCFWTSNFVEHKIYDWKYVKDSYQCELYGVCIVVNKEKCLTWCDEYYAIEAYGTYIKYSSRKKKLNRILKKD